MKNTAILHWSGDEPATSMSVDVYVGTGYRADGSEHTTELILQLGDTRYNISGITGLLCREIAKFKTVNETRDGSA